MAHNLQNRRFVCQKFLIFSRKFRRSGTRSSISAICVPRIVHFSPSDVHKTEPSWHTKPDFTTLCAKVIRCPAERQRPPGTQTSKKPICVPKLSAARPKGGAPHQKTPPGIQESRSRRCSAPIVGKGMRCSAPIVGRGGARCSSSTRDEDALSQQIIPHASRSN